MEILRNKRLEEASQRSDTGIQLLTNAKAKLQAAIDTGDTEVIKSAAQEIADTVTSVEDNHKNLKRILSELRRPVFENLDTVKRSIVDLLNQQVDTATAYAYAISIYSPSTLEQFDGVTREVIKETLRNYFADKGHEYYGWSKE